MAKKFRAGDKVEWETAQGKTHGKVIRRLTSETHVEGHKVAASKENPEYLVESVRQTGGTQAGRAQKAQLGPGISRTGVAIPPGKPAPAHQTPGEPGWHPA
jgi:hypothetical protein